VIDRIPSQSNRHELQWASLRRKLTVKWIDGPRKITTILQSIIKELGCVKLMKHRLSAAASAAENISNEERRKNMQTM
jgi:hypothetical protein